jgi:dTDP-4-amino-4,6-dideoxygalactose transaminase
MFRVYRNYGSEKRYYNRIIGANSRLDEMQAALLRIRLDHLEELNTERRKICAKYLNGIINPAVTLPEIRSGCETVWHQFAVRIKKREQFIAYLNERGIGALIHYPVPPHLQEAYKYLGHKRGDYPIAEQYADEVLSLPLYNGMTDEETDYVIKEINKWE